MKNSYILAGAIVLIIAIIFIFSGKKTEAPIEEMAVNEENSEFVAGNYQINTEESFIYWQGEFITGAKESGSVKLASGSLVVEGSTIVGGEFVIDMDTITSEPQIERLVNHLKSDDFFSVSTYPTSKFVLKTFEPTITDADSAGRYVVAGDLTIKGITKPISLVATVTEENGVLRAVASFAINRAEWDIRYNSASFFSNLGDRVIRDSVMMGLDLKAEKVIQ